MQVSKNNWQIILPLPNQKRTLKSRAKSGSKRSHGDSGLLLQDAGALGSRPYIPDT